MIETISPGIVIPMGGQSMMREFKTKMGTRNPNQLVIRMAHFAHRKGSAFEEMECERVRTLLLQKL